MTQIVKPRSHADIVNSQFTKSKSHYVSLPERLKNTVDGVEWKQALLADAKEYFKARFQTLKKWSSVTLCRSEMAFMSKIEIDVTLQRLFDIEHACNIIDHFKNIMVMPICVYVDPDRPGKYICWDGQHTAIVLYIIACEVLGEDIDKVKIPIVIYPSSMKAEMRECFINLNGEGKKQLDNIDKVHQKIYGVRTDGSTNPEWVLIEEKQQALEQNGIFLTHPKFGDTDQPGAYTRLDEFLDNHYELAITQQFAKLFNKVCGASRPVQPKESWMFYEYLRLCKVSKITVDDAYIVALSRSLRVHKNDFNATKLFDRAKTSYQEWFRQNKPNPDGTLWGITYSERPIGLTFLIAQIKKNMPAGFAVPKYNSNWAPLSTDLF